MNTARISIIKFYLEYVYINPDSCFKYLIQLFGKDKLYYSRESFDQTFFRTEAIPNFYWFRMNDHF